MKIKIRFFFYSFLIVPIYSFLSLLGDKFVSGDNIRYSHQYYSDGHSDDLSLFSLIGSLFRHLGVSYPGYILTINMLFLASYTWLLSQYFKGPRLAIMLVLLSTNYYFFILVTELHALKLAYFFVFLSLIAICKKERPHSAVAIKPFSLINVFLFISVLVHPNTVVYIYHRVVPFFKRHFTGIVYPIAITASAGSFYLLFGDVVYYLYLKYSYKLSYYFSGEISLLEPLKIVALLTFFLFFYRLKAGHFWVFIFILIISMFFGGGRIFLLYYFFIVFLFIERDRVFPIVLLSLPFNIKFLYLFPAALKIGHWYLP